MLASTVSKGTSRKAPRWALLFSFFGNVMMGIERAVAKFYMDLGLLQWRWKQIEFVLAGTEKLSNLH